jgi:hypothetical protein
VLPPTTKGYGNPDQSKLNKWLKSKDWSSKSKKVSEEIGDGEVVDVPEPDIPEPVDTEPDVDD